MRSLPVLIVLAIVATPVPGLARADGPLFAEDFEHGRDGWTVNGLGASFPCDEASCHLHFDPPCCSESVSVEHDLDVALQGRLAFSFTFTPHADDGDTDSNFYLKLDANGQVVYATTEWINNGLTLVTDQDTQRDFAQWHATDAPLTLRLVLDGDGHRVQAQMLQNGTAVGASRVLALAPNATRIVGVGMNAVSWTAQNIRVFDYDDLLLRPTTDCFVGHASIGAPWRVDVGKEAHFALGYDVGEDCGQVYWDLDFGDGATASGAGLPPGETTHAYGADGTYTAALRVTRADGAIAMARAVVWAHTLRPVEHTEYHAGTLVLATNVVGNAGTQDGAELRWWDAHNGTIDWSYSTRVDAQLHMVFYDIGGGRIGSCEAGHCVVPDGSAAFRIEGVGAVADWEAQYSYTTYE